MIDESTSLMSHSTAYHRGSQYRDTIQERIVPFALFTLSLLVYMYFAFYVNQNWISNDGGAYHRMAVNLAEGNGLSMEMQEPYDKQFFREPGYPFFFSIACQLNKLLGNKNEFLTQCRMENPNKYPNNYTEITILRLLQAILASIVVILFFYIMRSFLVYRVALTISIFFVFYLPFAYNVTQTMREMLVTLQLFTINYLVIKLAESKVPLIWDAIIGLIAASLILTLQAYVFILPLFALSSYMIRRDYRRTVLSWTIITLVFIAGVTPWIYRAYNEYSDLRVAKTFGVSYTYEMKKYFDANAKALRIDFKGQRGHYRKVLNDEYWVPGRLQFERSFSGYYESMADSLKREINTKELNTFSKQLTYVMNHIVINNYRKSLIWPLWRPNYPSSISSNLNSENKWSMLFSLLAGVVVSGIALWGMYIKLRSVWYYIPVFVFHFIMIPVMADEGRRVIPFLPFLFMFFMLGLWDVVHLIKNKSIRQLAHVLGLV